MQALTREILLSFWKVHILHHAAEGPVYGQWIITELRRHGYDISPGTLYPLLQRMERHGWLQSNGDEAGGGAHARRNYHLTAKGREVIRQWRGPASPFAPCSTWRCCWLDPGSDLGPRSS